MAFPSQLSKPPAGSTATRDCSHIYGSRFASEHMPWELPEDEMPKEVAYRMIKDDLALDGTPMLNLASFVTTYMEDEAEKLIVESMNKNIIDHEEYPKSVEIEQRCVRILADLFNSPKENEKPTAIGTACIGSSEAIMLAVLAMKRRWKNQRQAQGKDTSQPNIIMSTGVQVCWEKAARYFEIDEQLVPCTDTRYVIDPAQAVDLVDENTIGICAIFGTTYTGQYEDVKGINDMLVERRLDTPIHVDAASGGFVAPFVIPELEWDFRLSNVVSINASGHKYGLVYPGIGWALWRSAEYLPEELIFKIDYLGADQVNFTLNFSKPASNIVAQYYQMIRLGKRGYQSIMTTLTRTADYLADQLKSMGFIIMSDGCGTGLPVVAFRLGPDQSVFFDEFELAHKIRERGWIVPAYTMAADCKMSMCRVVVREDFTQSRADSLLHDIKHALVTLVQRETINIQRYQLLLSSSQIKSSQKLCVETSCVELIDPEPEKNIF
ncbi:Pyridoxal phosphate-dependent transferase major region subdomain 1 [Penicillium angulare]|uniref:Glutamate decarboxylase n=1 Tax=Penicillium angulare TaxID=116970 RepID=A0A9W9KPD3_9EURO|nr:Pyridoxal phosphate-dependent transferase major region subdomain 1 [Penicillium angulare]